MKKILVIVLGLILSAKPAFPQKRTITAEDLWNIRRVGKFSLSPDGQWIAYTVTQYNMEKNWGQTDLYLISTMGGTSIQLTTHPGDDWNPQWNPDGTLLAFISDRNGTPQIHIISLKGGEAKCLSDIPAGVNDFIWSPDGKHVAFTSRIIPDTDKNKLQSENRSPQVKARIIDKLLYRHWNHWLDNRRSHVFVMPVNGEKIWDITPGNFDSPPVSLGSSQDFTFSPDGKEIAFVRNTEKVIATSTNNDIFVVSYKGGTIRKITKNRANDNHPVYSPDGQYLAFRSMSRPGFEADQYDLMLYNRKTGRLRNLTSEFDLDIGEIVWEPSSKFIYFTSPDQGRRVIFHVDIKKEKIKGLLHSGTNSNLCISPDENYLYIRRTLLNLPVEIFRCNWNGEDLFQLTYSNTFILNQLEMNAVTDFWFPSFDGKIIHGLLLKPPFFDPAKRYPAIFLIHGGPQGAWEDEFHYRWNAQMFASRGYVVIMINPRGSKGYGQTFCDAVTQNWGGVSYRDLMTGFDYVLKKYPFIMEDKTAAAGASYGGYMVNWIAGHTDRFRCLVSHDGLFDLFSFYGATEELWFPEWEFGGNPYENPKQYDKWSPLKYAKNFVTPTLVIHGEKDYRTPVDQGLQMFTALQKMNVPSRLLYFPDEGHFVTKPQNARLWWNTVLDWIDQWTKTE
jgi:dipeptidyl aminopeptidase/acylaminoacyl peptidase